MLRSTSKGDPFNPLNRYFQRISANIPFVFLLSITPDGCN
ncbi:hypothetical protein M083_3824 [Bacteroides fragilis str. 3986 T(B)9]|uniref:Uncharacterized protein n=8 Tax=Bacteroides fragilis TaxID=817 RepID=A0A015V0A1_BACFG|nr:hypothetical protein M101_3903 [Bacteroides fragilis str. 1007-1-F \